MKSSRFIELGIEEEVPVRSFTEPDLSGKDLEIAREKLTQLKAALSLIPEAPVFPDIRYSSMGNEIIERTVLFRPEKLKRTSLLAGVGFFGQVSPSSTPEIKTCVWQTDLDLIHSVQKESGFWAYSSMRLPNKIDWGNVAWFANWQAATDWLANPLHQYTARVLAPQHFATVRIHNFVVDLPIHWVTSLEPEKIRLLTTKYYDFQEEIPWLAQRNYERASLAPRIGSPPM